MDLTQHIENEIKSFAQYYGALCYAAGQDGKNNLPEGKEFIDHSTKIIYSIIAQQSNKTLSQIENIMERWHHARDNDAETLQKINDELAAIGMLSWFNKTK